MDLGPKNVLCDVYSDANELEIVEQNVRLNLASNIKFYCLFPDKTHFDKLVNDYKSASSLCDELEITFEYFKNNEVEENELI